MRVHPDDENFWTDFRWTVTILVVCIICGWLGYLISDRKPPQVDPTDEQFKESVVEAMNDATKRGYELGYKTAKEECKE